MSVIAGRGGWGAPAPDGEKAKETSVAVASNGDVYFTEPYFWRVRKISGGVVTTVAGNGQYPDIPPHEGDKATTVPIPADAIAIDADDNLYVTGQPSQNLLRIGNDNTVHIAWWNQGWLTGASGMLTTDPAGFVWFAPPSLHDDRDLFRVENGSAVSKGNFTDSRGTAVAVDSDGSMYVGLNGAIRKKAPGRASSYLIRHCRTRRRGLARSHGAG